MPGFLHRGLGVRGHYLLVQGRFEEEQVYMGRPRAEPSEDLRRTAAEHRGLGPQGKGTGHTRSMAPAHKRFLKFQD